MNNNKIMTISYFPHFLIPHDIPSDTAVSRVCATGNIPD